MKSSTNTHGGKRTGAGRPRLDVKPVSITLTEADIEYLKTIHKKPTIAIRQLIAASRKD